MSDGRGIELNWRLGGWGVGGVDAGYASVGNIHGAFDGKGGFGGRRFYVLLLA